MKFDDEIWDEDRWEAFLSESDRQMERRLAIYLAYVSENPRPDESAAEYDRWLDGLRNFFFDAGIEDENSLVSVFSQEVPGDFLERWEDEESDAIDDELLSVERLPFYRKAFELSGDLLRWSDEVPVADKDSLFVQFCTSVTQIPANVAKGHAMGFEKEMMGGNIAFAKRGLQSANQALSCLRNLKNERYLSPARYVNLYERLFEIRNELGVYVQTLRERFNLGID